MTQAVVSHTQIINARTINQVRVGFTRKDLRAISLNGGRNTAEEFGIPNVNVDEYTTGLSAISAAGYPRLGDNFWNPEILPTNNIQFSDNLEMNRGNHSFLVRVRCGAPSHEWLPDLKAPWPVRILSQVHEQSRQRQEHGIRPAELLLGKPATVLLVYMQGTRGMRGTDYAGYFQEDWKVTQKLTL